MSRVTVISEPSRPDLNRYDVSTEHLDELDDEWFVYGAVLLPLYLDGALFPDEESLHLAYWS